MRQRCAFTLVELLVVIAIIGVLIGMLLPAVQQVREAARRISCANNIRNIALGLLNYESAHQKFPPGWTSQQSPGLPGFGWMAFNLPFVEQSNLHNQIDFRGSSPEQVNEETRRASFDLLICPSSPASEYTYQLQYLMGGPPPIEMGRTHYVGSIGPDAELPIYNSLLDHGGRYRKGVFYENSRTGFAQIQDGSSNTILLGERSGNSRFTTPTDGDFFGSSWLGVVEESTYAGWRVVAWTTWPPKHGGGPAFPLFNSNHPGLTVFGFCDGSVHNIRDDIDWTTFRSLGTINGGEVVGDYR